VLVECKNWERRVGAPDIKKFAANVRAASCHSGIVATRTGITGRTDELTDARYTIRRHYHRDGIVIIVLAEDDVDRMIHGQVAVPDLLLSKYEAIRFDER
jgi:hypothetical protein